MNYRAGRLALLLTPLLLLGACGSAGQQHSVRLLNNRLQTRLQPDITAGRAVVQPVQDGARVTLLDSSMFPNDKVVLDDMYPEVRANVIEGMLDPSLMRVQVADTSTLPDYQRSTRVANVKVYFAAYGLGQVLEPSEPTAPASSSDPAGLTITIRVQCPSRPSDGDYDGGLSRPVCD